MNETECKVVFQTEWFNIEEEYFPVLGDKPYYRMNCDDNVIVLAQTAAGKIILIRQFRPAIRKVSIEVPCGAIDPGETPAEAAARELYEETGYRCRKMEQLGKGKLLMNRMNADEYLFWAPDCVLDETFIAHESIETLLVTPPELKALVLEGEFEQISTLSLLLLSDWKANTGFCS